MDSNQALAEFIAFEPKDSENRTAMVPPKRLTWEEAKALIGKPNCPAIYAIVPNPTGGQPSNKARR